VTINTPGADDRIKRCHFCPNCSTLIRYGSNAPGQSVSIKAGALDDTRNFHPTAQVWLQSAQPWFAIERERYLCFETAPRDKAVLAKQQARESDNG